LIFTKNKLGKYLAEVHFLVAITLKNVVNTLTNSPFFPVISTKMLQTTLETNVRKLRRHTGFGVLINQSLFIRKFSSRLKIRRKS